jgi:hypothetical protein
LPPVHFAAMLSSLEADRVRVAELEAQILDLERAVTALRIEQAIAQERLDSYRYPVLTLPNEIISEIFVQFLPMYSGFPPLTGILSPTLLTQICCKWREIALGTPLLWNAIELTPENHIHLERQVEIAHTWLGRSRCCPLSLDLEFIDEAQANFSHVLTIVVPHRTRLEYLLLYISPTYLPTIEGPMPLLWQLSLILEHSTFASVVTFREVPLLRTVILNGAATSSVILPWAQLTSLTLLFVSPDQCTSILKQTSSLVECEVKVRFVTGNHQPGPDIIITLPRLESFKVTLIDPPDDLETSYLETFIFPALIYLKIAGRLLGSNPIDSLTSFISKSSCKLQEMSITGETSIGEDSYREAFPSIPLLCFGDDEDVDSDANSN